MTVFLKVDVNKRSPVRVNFSELIYNIVTEVIVIGTVYLELIQYTVLIKAFFYKSLVVILTRSIYFSFRSFVYQISIAKNLQSLPSTAIIPCGFMLS